jgi:hypothetical protein
MSRLVFFGEVPCNQSSYYGVIRSIGVSLHLVNYIIWVVEENVRTIGESA